MKKILTKQFKLTIFALMITMFIVSCGSNPKKNISKKIDSVILRLNYEIGDSYVLDMKMTQDMGTAMFMDMSIQMTQDVTSVTGDEYVSEMRIAKMTMDMNQGGINVSFDSSKSDDELDAPGKMMKAQMGPMLQAVITSKGNNLGEVLSTTVEPNVPGASDMANQSGSVVYPTEAVKVGGTWTFTKEEKGMKMNFTYKVKAITSKNVIVDIAGDLTGAASGTITGNMTIDKKSGVPTNSKIDMDMSVQGQAVKSTVIITMTKK